MNAKLAAIKILENAKKAIKDKIESLEKAEHQPHPGASISEHQKIYDRKKQSEEEARLKSPEGEKERQERNKKAIQKAEGKNTAQLNEFKGIPQPPAPKAPEKAIAPTPKIPQPKMPGLGRVAKPLSSFMKKKEEKLQSGMAKADGVDKYNYYIVHKATGEVHGGNEYRSDAVDASKDQREPASAYKIVHHSKMDPKVKEDFHRKNKNMSLMNRSKKITKSGL